MRKSNVILNISSPLGIHSKTGIKINLTYPSGKEQNFSLDFVCFLDVGHCKISTSSKRGLIYGLLSKDEINVGKSLLPFRLIDDAELRAFNSSSEIVDYMQNRKVLDLMFLSVADIELINTSQRAGKAVDDPFFCFRQTDHTKSFGSMLKQTQKSKLSHSAIKKPTVHLESLANSI